MAEIGLSGLMLDFPHSGSAVYARNLVRHLPQVAPDLQFHVFLRDNHVLDASIPTARLSTPFTRLNVGQGIGARLDKLAWEAVALPLAAAARRECLLHSLYFAAPPIVAAPLVVTIHDLIPLVVPGYHRTRQSALYSRLMAWTVKRAAAIITVSEHSKRDILRAFGVPEERVFVTYEATDERFHPLDEDGQAAAVNAKYGLPERFVLYVGSAERRKNLEILVRAWARVAARMREREIRLVIVARFPPPDPLYPDVPALARELGLGRDVLFVPQIREEDKPDLYRASLVFCFPSTYEGFGFPALEAMACGIPVIASNATSIPEVVGDSACLLEPYDTAAWADALLTLADSPSQRESMRQRGLERAARFSWRCTAEQTVEVYREVLGR